MRAVLPNLVTASRGLAGVAIAVLVIVLEAPTVAFAVFLLAVASDLVDGALARALGSTSRLGFWLDPLADKLLLGSSWAVLWWVGYAPVWLVLPLLLRDGLVALGWSLFRWRGQRIEANALGRLMVSFEGISIAVLLWRNEVADVDWPTVGTLIGAIALLLSVASGIAYLLPSRS